MMASALTAKTARCRVFNLMLLLSHVPSKGPGGRMLLSTRDEPRPGGTVLGGRIPAKAATSSKSKPRAIETVLGCKARFRNRLRSALDWPRKPALRRI
jgi:hypothetical protein